MLKYGKNRIIKSHSGKMTDSIYMNYSYIPSEAETTYKAALSY